MTTSVFIRQSSLPTLRNNKSHLLLQSAKLFLEIASAPLAAVSDVNTNLCNNRPIGDIVARPNQHQIISSNLNSNNTEKQREAAGSDIFESSLLCNVKEKAPSSNKELIIKREYQRNGADSCSVNDETAQNEDEYQSVDSGVSSLDSGDVMKFKSMVSLSGHEESCKSKIKRKVKGKKSKKKQRHTKSTTMKNKSNIVDLPSVTKAASRLMLSKTTNVSLNFGAQCSAVKIHHNPQYYQSTPETLVKNGDYYSSVYGTASYGTKACQSANILQSPQRIGRVSVNDFSPSARSVSPKVSLSRRSVSHTNNMLKKITKIYQSQSQSGTVVVCGMEIPCAPPATPTPEQLKYHQYVPSLNDVMGQRAVKLRLEKLERKEQKKEEKKKGEEMRQEKLNQQDKLFDLRRKQRLEIYALNKIMTELENKKFLEFCHLKGIS